MPVFVFASISDLIPIYLFRFAFITDVHRGGGAPPCRSKIQIKWQKKSFEEKNQNSVNFALTPAPPLSVSNGPLPLRLSYVIYWLLLRLPLEIETTIKMK